MRVGDDHHLDGTVALFEDGTSALGKLGGLDNPFCVKVLNDHKTTIYAGLIALAVLYIIGWEIVIGGID